MSVFNPYKVRVEKHSTRTFQFENDEDQLRSVAKFENLMFPTKSTSYVDGSTLELSTLFESLRWLVS